MRPVAASWRTTTIRLVSAMPTHHLAGDPFYRLGRWVHGRRWYVLAVWLIGVLVALPAAPGASRALSPGGFATSQLEASQATRTIQNALGENPSTLLVIFHSPTLATTDFAFYDAVDASLRDLKTLDLVARVT